MCGCVHTLPGELEKEVGMRRLISLIAIGLALVLATNVVVLARSPNEVRTTGDERVVPNAMVQATLRFTPGMIKVASGDIITWTHDDATTEPHTVTIVEEFPGATLDEIFGCGAPGEPCAEALAAHGALGPVVDVGVEGFNEPGDSLFFFAPPPNGVSSISAKVTAPAGTTLKYLCAIHPWMQGQIVVGE
jgi:plastocyanin